MSTVETIIVTHPGDMARVTGLVDGLAARHRLPGDAVADMQVALDEVLTNIITHGFSGPGRHEIRVRLTLEGDCLEAEVEDDGRPFDPLAVPAPQLGGSLQEREPGGLGIHFVRALMSEVAYSLVDNKNRLVLRRRLGGRTEGDRRGRT